MNKRTKLILTIIGAAAVIVPAVLLITLSAKEPGSPQVSSDKRNIDTRNIEEVARRSAPVASPVAVPSPSPSTDSASLASPSPSPLAEEGKEDLEE
ncbi:hypothetical protein HYZ70_02800 [Candidatus Curtissbacteria bacterium]|nr:hypothetical protein [Candidatus Curtissbacteria bacterium]